VICLKDAMTLLGSTVVLYLVVGVGVAVAVYLSAARPSITQLWFRMATAVPFWPMYLPILLAAPRQPSESSRAQLLSAPEDDMSAAISQVDAELESALSSLDGWAEDVLARERDRIRELRDAWIAQAERVREMDRLLALPQYSSSNITAEDAEERREINTASSLLCDSPRPLRFLSYDNNHPPAQNRLMQSQEACRQNIERLRLVRRRAYEDLLGNLAWVRELVSMIHLAKFTGAPASRAEELVAQIAAAVEGLSELTWKEESPVSVADNTSNPE
jgi:hypothetical protein